jgi:hypothetical protein
MLVASGVAFEVTGENDVSVAGEVLDELGRGHRLRLPLGL